MTLLLAEFRDPHTLLEAVRRARGAGIAQLEAHTPFKVDGMAEALGLPSPSIRPVMLIVGLAMAGAAFCLQWYSAVLAYPLNLGGRPLNSWQTFVISGFEVGVLAAGIAGFVAFLRGGSLPRPHRPIFAAHGFERATEDRFFLSVTDPTATVDQLRELLDGLGALSVHAAQS
jgi:hypothetical protein